MSHYENQNLSGKNLKFSQTVLKAAIESFTDGVFLIDRDGQEVLGNRRFYELWNIPTTIRSLHSIRIMIDTVAEQLIDPSRFISRIHKITEDQKNDFFDTLYFKDGRIMERYARVQIIDGQFQGRVWTFRDVTDTRQSSRHLRTALMTAASTTQVKNDFLAKVSEEFKKPTQEILSALDQLDSNSSLLSTIRSQAEHLLNLTQDLIDLSKIENGKLELDHTPFSLIECVNGIVTLFRYETQAKKIAVSIRVETPLPEPLESDPFRFRQILINLIGNAVQYTEQGEIQINITFEEPYDNGGILKIKVIDTGIGMTPEEMNQLFKPFTRSEFGLTHSKRLAEQLEGNLTVYSEKGIGSEFTFEVPIRSEQTIKLVAVTPIELNQQ